LVSFITQGPVKTAQASVSR